jgi:beta-lactamase regulating signal transducer with metallopeptidase domain
MHLAALFNSFAQAAGPVAITGLWQGLAIASALALCLKWAPRISAAHRFMLWSAGFVALAALPLVPVILTALGPSTSAASVVSSVTASSHIWLQLDSRWALAIAALWLLLSAVRVADLLIHSLRLRRLWRSATPIESPALPTPLRPVEICSTKSLDRPSVIGFFAPRILIPEWLFPRLTPGEVDQIVLHESTHLARRDDWTNLLQKLSLVLFPLNPALVWIDRQLAKEREMACDESVVRTTEAPRAYAACLANLAEHGLEHRGFHGQAFVRGENRRAEVLSLGAWQRRSELADRVHRILRGSRGLPPATARILLGTLATGLFAVSLELARCPRFVSFVAPASIGTQTVELGDAVYPTNSRRNTFTPGARLIQAKAVLPAARKTKPLASRARIESTFTESGPTESALMKEPAVGELRATSSEPGTLVQNQLMLSRRQAVEAPRQFIVFTAWEQIETSTPSAQTVADYDTDGARANPSSETAAKATAQTAPDSARNTSRVTITRLIFRVLPPRSQSVAQTGFKTGPKTGSESSGANLNTTPVPPTAIPIGDGWFVIQL